MMRVPGSRRRALAVVLLLIAVGASGCASLRRTDPGLSEEELRGIDLGCVCQRRLRTCLRCPGGGSQLEHLCGQCISLRLSTEAALEAAPALGEEPWRQEDD